MLKKHLVHNLSWGKGYLVIERLNHQAAKRQSIIEAHIGTDTHILMCPH